MDRRRHGDVRSARGYLESPKRPGRAAAGGNQGSRDHPRPRAPPRPGPRIGFGLINARIPGGQRSSACISSRITTVIQVTVGAIKGTITDLMSHSQFHCTGRAYLHVHGLIFETSICYWQDQPGRRRSEEGASGEAAPRGEGRRRRKERPGESDQMPLKGARTRDQARPSSSPFLAADSRGADEGGGGEREGGGGGGEEAPRAEARGRVACLSGSLSTRFNPVVSLLWQTQGLCGADDPTPRRPAPAGKVARKARVHPAVGSPTSGSRGRNQPAGDGEPDDSRGGARPPRGGTPRRRNDPGYWGEAAGKLHPTDPLGPKRIG
ncbi:uncharacterized protein LOC122930876 [Bufo gargarizans]|uniref:uncharacterized protein LOC122930876 n=1 Tax=Bufo gargarizans TaxID=30331 RepID=UPI001CF32D50|nr:uncharacterized protein LOC122930876 [Bufo gargarizans]